MITTLRGLVYNNFPSVRKFAKALGWDRTKANNIVNGSREPRISDLSDMAKVLNMPIEELAEFFLRN